MRSQCSLVRGRKTHHPAMFRMFAGFPAAPLGTALAAPLPIAALLVAGEGVAAALLGFLATLLIAVIVSAIWFSVFVPLVCAALRFLGKESEFNLVISLGGLASAVVVFSGVILSRAPIGELPVLGVLLLAGYGAFFGVASGVLLVRDGRRVSYAHKDE